jgi:hypothetical protein
MTDETEPLYKPIARLRGWLHENNSAIKDLDRLVDLIARQDAEITAILDILADHPDEEMRKAVAGVLDTSVTEGDSYERRTDTSNT